MLFLFCFIAFNFINVIIAGSPNDACQIYNFQYQNIIAGVNVTINRFANRGIAKIDMYQEDNPSEPYPLFRIQMNDITNDEFNRMYNEIFKIFRRVADLIPGVMDDDVQAYLLLGKPAAFPLTCITDVDVLQEIFLTSFQRLSDHANAVASKHI